MGIFKCSCEKWEKSWPEIEKAQVFAWTHGILYEGLVFEFCPWCAKELKECEPEKEDK